MCVGNTWTLAWSLGLVSWQCPWSWCTCCPWDFGWNICNNTESPSIFTRFGPPHLLVIPEIDNHIERPMVVRCCQHYETCKDYPEEHSRRGISEMLWTVKMLCCCARRLLWMWQELLVFNLLVNHRHTSWSIRKDPTTWASIKMLSCNIKQFKKALMNFLQIHSLYTLPE